MDRHELNDIIRAKYGDRSVDVSQLVYEEVERVYLDTYYELKKMIDKEGIADLWMKFDYQGFRNIQLVINDFARFKDEVVTNVCEGKFTNVAPSQYAFLEMIGWNVKKLNLKQEACWCG